LVNDDGRTKPDPEDPEPFEIGREPRNLHTRTYTELPKESEFGLDSINTKNVLIRRSETPMVLSLLEIPSRNESQKQTPNENQGVESDTQRVMATLETL
jgi:hypothetical protein